MQTLLIFNEIPESQTIYLIPDAPDWLPLVDDLFINGTDMTPEQELMMLRVGDALCKNPEHFDNPNDDLAGQWVKHEITPRSIIEGPVQIIQCGFIM